MGLASKECCCRVLQNAAHRECFACIKTPAAPNDESLQNAAEIVCKSGALAT